MCVLMVCPILDPGSWILMLQGIRASSPQGPLAAKGFNLMSLVNLAVPGSTNMLGQVSAMMQVVTSVGDMSAVFIVTYATLQAVAGAKAAASS